MMKTLVSVDMVSYSSIARSLQQQLSASAVAQLNSQIQRFVDLGLGEINGGREANVLGTTGDGAILVFDAAEHAHRFARTFHEASREHNRTRDDQGTQRWFRTGAATGEVHVQESNGRREYAGTVIADAVRLEAASDAGSFLVDLPTWSRLPPFLQAAYSPEETVKGKREERFHAKRWRIVSAAPYLEVPTPRIVRGGPSTDRREALRLIDQIDASEIDKLIWLIEMPVDQRPPAVAAPASRKGAILSWVDTRRGCGVDVLIESLRIVLG